MDNKFFTFVKPYLSFIDKGELFRKPFSWLYIIIAVINLIVPLYIFYVAVDNHIFNAPAKNIITFILVWIIIAFAGWVSFQLWWDRKSKIMATSKEGDEFVVTPVFSHLIQTLGEWIGTWIAIVGFGIALLSNIFLGDDGDRFSRFTGLDFLGTELQSIIIMPLVGFFIIVISRFLAEQFRALASIANNTRKN